MAAAKPDLAVYVDWDNDGFWCRDALRGDGINRVPNPVTWAGIGIDPEGGTAEVIAKPTRYGLNVLRIVTDANLNNGANFGRDSAGAVDDIPVTNGTTYRAWCWLRGVANYAGINVEVEIRNAAGTQLAISSAAVLTDDWVRFDCGTFTIAGGDTFIRFNPQKNNSAAIVTFEATGFMLRTGTAAAGAFNAGDATNGYDAVLADVKQMRWHLGMRQPWQLTSDESRLELTLENSDRLYSPEYGGGALHGYLLPLRKITIEDDASGEIVYDGTAVVNDGADIVYDHGDAQPLYTGYLEKFAPDMGLFSGPWECRIEATSAKVFMERTELALPLQRNKRADQILRTLFTYVVAPPSADAGDQYDFDLGRTIYPWVGDNWDNYATAWDAVKALLEGERGKFFFARDGSAVFYNRERFQKNITVADTFDNTMHGMAYLYGADVRNEVRVTYYARKLDTGDNVLWAQDGELTLRGGESQEIRARFAAADGQRVGGRNLVAPNTSDGSLAFDEGTATLTGFTEEAQAAVFTLTNDSNSADCVISTLEVHGQKLTAWNGQQRKSRNPTSIADYGLRVETIDGKLIQSAEFAKNLAAFVVRQKRGPRGLTRSLTLKNQDAALVARQLARQIGDRIALAEDQTVEGGEYFIVGEGHAWRAKGTEYTVTWDLEPAALFDSWLIGVAGRGEIGETTVVGL